MSKRTAEVGEPAEPATKTRKKKIPGVVSINPERCKGCAYCVAFCPLGVLAMSRKFNSKGYHYPEVVNAEKCTGCGLCGMYCPDFAIHGARAPEAEEPRSKKPHTDPKRSHRE